MSKLTDPEAAVRVRLCQGPGDGFESDVPFRVARIILDQGFPVFYLPFPSGAIVAPDRPDSPEINLWTGRYEAPPGARIVLSGGVRYLDLRHVQPGGGIGQCGNFTITGG